MTWREKRVTLRHVVELPIKYRELSVSETGKSKTTLPSQQTKTKDISTDGLLFLSPEPFHIGAQLGLSVPAQGSIFSVKAQVVHTSHDPNSRFFRIGVRFLNSEGLFKIKMAEQIYQIEQYQKMLSLREKREVPTEEAAERWISEHSKEFAKFYKL